MTLRHPLFAAALLILGLPLLSSVFLWAKVVHGEALIAQDRRNRHGRRYRHWRYRTAPPARPARDDGSRFAAWAVPPVTRLGMFLYQTRTDELPALWNVLVGDINWHEFVAVFAETADA